MVTLLRNYRVAEFWRRDFIVGTALTCETFSSF